MEQRPEAISGADIVVGANVLREHAVLVEDRQIIGVVRRSEIPERFLVRDVGLGYLVPGFVDLHSHGAGGRGFNEADPEALRTALTVLVGSGVTTVLPTLASAPLPAMVAAIDTFTEFGAEQSGRPGQQNPTMPHTPGIHLEGPYFAPAQRGAQDLAALRIPDDGSVDILLDRAESIRMVSFAPELRGSVALTERLVAAGIVAAAGHTDGRDTDLWACQRAGLSHVTHLFSGQSTTVRHGPWRLPGMLEATLASDGLTVELIADGKHLPTTLMRLAVRCLSGRLCIVSDSTPGAGLPDGAEYRLGDQRCVVDGGVGMTMDRTAFAGSTTLTPAMLRILVRDVGVALPSAIAMFTSVPAAAARLSNVGTIAAGYAADLVVLDPSLTVTAVAVAGHWQSKEAVQ